MKSAYLENTLRYDSDACNGCGMCSMVCPHGVFTQNGQEAVLASPRRCMECGACMVNCPTGAIEVESGVGCAAAIMYAALRGKKEEGCGCEETPSCCS